MTAACRRLRVTPQCVISRSDIHFGAMRAKGMYHDILCKTIVYGLGIVQGMLYKLYDNYAYTRNLLKELTYNK
jgi:hypothetical protein